MRFSSGLAAHLTPELVTRHAQYRYRVFVEKLGWDLKVHNGLETDQFDRDDTLYVVALDAADDVIGTARLLPTTRPYLLAEVFPQLLGALAPPCTPAVWELSRFAAVDFDAPAKSRAGNTVKFFDGYIAADVADPLGVVDAVRKHEQEHGHKPAAVIPMNDFTVRSALAVAKEYGLHHNPEATVDHCRDKFLMKQRLEAAGLPVPRYAAFTDLAELRVLAAEFDYPLVIKPRELAGSVGVIKVERASDLDAAYRQCIADIHVLGGTWKTPEDVFQVEQYISATHEVSVEVFNHGDLHRVIAVTDKYLGPEPYFVETGHSVPSVHSENRDLIVIAERACAALEIRHGMAHFEARITPAGELRIIEIGARTGGDAIMDLVERVYGINPYELHVASYLGRTPTLPERFVPRGLSAVAFLKAPPGRIEQVGAPGAMPDWVVNLQVTAKPLDVSEAPLSWRAREGSVEYFWNGRPPEPGFQDHLRFARELSARLFRMQAAT